MTGSSTADPRPTSDEHWRIERLYDAPTPEGRVRGGPLSPDLAQRYGADLAIALRADRPTIMSNFVSTIDGVVAFDTEGHTGGREVSGASAPDRFLMGLIRATSDAVLMGAGTLRSGARHRWTPAYIYPPSADAYAAWRRELGLAAAQPTTVIVSASGSLDPGHPGLHDRAFRWSSSRPPPAARTCAPWACRPRWRSSTWRQGIASNPARSSTCSAITAWMSSSARAGRPSWAPSSTPD